MLGPLHSRRRQRGKSQMWGRCGCRPQQAEEGRQQGSSIADHRRASWRLSMCARNSNNLPDPTWQHSLLGVEQLGLCGLEVGDLRRGRVGASEAPQQPPHAAAHTPAECKLAGGHLRHPIGIVGADGGGQVRVGWAGEGGVGSRAEVAFWQQHVSTLWSQAMVLAVLNSIKELPTHCIRQLPPPRGTHVHHTVSLKVAGFVSAYAT